MVPEKALPDAANAVLNSRWPFPWILRTFRREREEELRRRSQETTYLAVDELFFGDKGGE
jgi:hypothetical protein